MTDWDERDQNIRALRALDPPLSGFVADITQSVRQGQPKLTRKLYRALADYVVNQQNVEPFPESSIRTAVQGIALGILPVEVNPCIDTLVAFLMTIQRATLEGAPLPSTPEERSKDPFDQKERKQPWEK